MVVKKWLLILIFLITARFSICQSSAGFRIGLVFSIGTTINKIGLSTSAFYTYKQIQLNLRIGGHYNLTGLGPSKSGKELQISFGPQYCFGIVDSIKNDFMFSFGNQAGRRNSIGYFYNVYADQVQTSQTTGTISLQFGRTQIISENDIFGKPASDKFRTAAVMVMYRMENTILGMNSVLWIGNPKGAPTIYDKDYKGRFGYKNLSQNQYGTYSNGICSVQFQQLIPYGGVLKADVGIDSEYVRYVVQDLLIHDMYFFPKKWNKAQNPHYPMLDSEGQPYLFKPGQKFKPSELYLQFSTNTGFFY